jgi:CheY-like chemotaxis protein
MNRNSIANCDDPFAKPAALLEGVRVLVVDDNADIREMLGIVLQQYGAEVRAVASAAEALETLEQSLPDVLVSDIGLPEQDGYGLIRQVRSLRPEQGGSIPALALTAWSGAEDRLRALSAGFHSHLAKPTDPDELATVVARLSKTGTIGS